MEPGATRRNCSACGTPCRPTFHAPPPELAPDLDFRPGEPTRSTLKHWLATCRGCGATAPDLAALPRGARETAATPEYRALAGPARAFLRWAMLHEAAGEPAEAAEAMLQAAWATDDVGGDAAPFRRRAAALWGEPSMTQDALRLIDVLRRAGAADAAAQRISALLAKPGLDETDAALLRFQQGLVAAGDTGRHLLSSALRPPARTPHVSHGQRLRGPSRSLWQRLVGR